MATMQQIIDEVSRQRSVEQSVVALIGGLSQKITDLKNIGGATPEQLDSILNDLKKNTDDLAAAVQENTPQAPPADGGATDTPGAADVSSGGEPKV